MSTPKKMRCAHCGKEFVTSRHDSCMRRFCSRECAIKGSAAEKDERIKKVMASRLPFRAGKFPSEWVKEFVRSTSAKFPPQTPMEEDELIKANMNNRGHLSFLLMMHNARFANDQACRYCGLYDSADADDLFSLGMMALWRAAMDFDFTRGVRFLTYAGEAVKRAIMEDAKRVEFLREAKSISLERQAESIGDGGDDNRDKDFDGFVNMYEDPSCVREKPLCDVLELRDMASFAKLIVSHADVSDAVKSDYLRIASGETATKIGAERGVSRQCIQQRMANAERMVRAKRDELLRKFGERSLCRTTNYDRLANACVHRDRGRTRFVVEHRCPWDIECLIAFERYQLDKKYGALPHGTVAVKWKRPVGPTLAGNGFTATSLVVNGHEIRFVDGKWRFAEKEEDYGFKEAVNV